MTYTTAHLAEFVDGRLLGPGDRVVSAAAPLEDAHPAAISFVASPKQYARLAACEAGALIVPNGWQIETPCPTIEVERPLAAMLAIAALFKPPVADPKPGVDPRAFVHREAALGEDVYVGPFAVIEAGASLGRGCIIHGHAVVRAGVVLGADVVVHPHAVLYPQTVVGDRTIIHSGAVVGCDGFGYQNVEGKQLKIPQLGWVEIGCDVEVGAGSTIDRGTLGATRIGDGTKIDNQVMIGHNCRIGKHNVFVSQSGMAGSCVTGDNVVLAGKAGVADHVRLGAGALLGANSGTFVDVPAGGRYFGSPSTPERDWLRAHVLTRKIPELQKQLKDVRRRLGLTDDPREQRAAG